jgi:hypothetical protein
MTPEQIAHAASSIVSGARMNAYGHPLDNLTRIGRLWAALLDVEEITAEQVALCMVALKLSREVHRSYTDNLVDGIGYLLACSEIYAERARRDHAGKVPQA